MKLIKKLALSTLLITNLLALGTTPCTNPFKTLNWGYFFDDFLIGSYGTDDEERFEDADGDGNSDGGGLCFCKETADGTADAGLKMRYSEPIGFIELVNTPYKFTCFEGDSGKGGFMKLRLRGFMSSYRNAHFIQYPVFALLNFGLDQICTSKEFPLDIPFLGELNPLWNDDFTAVLANPTALLTANPIAQMACVWDCAASTLGTPTEYLSWCNGCWQGRRLNTGRPLGDNPPVSDAALAVSVLDHQHMAWQLPQTIQIPAKSIAFLDGAMFRNANDIACGATTTYFPKVIKNQYVFQTVYPTSTAKMITLGEEAGVWSSFKQLPSYQDRIYAVWRKKVCCIGILNAEKLF